MSLRDHTGVPELTAAADPLAEALHFLRMNGMFYCKSELTVPWGVQLPAIADSLWFHVVTAGSCTLTDAAGRTRRVRQGDIVILPHGGGHRAAEPADAPTPVVFDLPHDYISPNYAVLRHGGPPSGSEPAPPTETSARTDLVCGVVEFDHPAARSLIELLPEIIHIDAAAAAAWHWFPSLLALMAHETRSARAGGEAVVTRLCDVVVIQAIRWWIEHDPVASTGWLGAMRDPVVGEALTAIHRDPAADWTVQRLASQVAVSRSSFSARFTALVGEAPMAYVTKWRMYVATDLLRHHGQSIAQVASRTGYRSEASFSRAFKRVMGVPPSSARSRDLLI